MKRPAQPRFVLAVALLGIALLRRDVRAQAEGTLVGIIPVAVSAPGLFGSVFKTSAQIYNPGSSTISGQLAVLGPGPSGGSLNRSLSFSLSPGQTVSYADVLAAAGYSGVASADLRLPTGSQLPIVLARVYNDAGAAGTAGFTEGLLDLAGGNADGFLFAGQTGVLIGPSDVIRFRFNIGIRTLFSPVDLTATVRDSAGVIVRTITKHYVPIFFEQTDAASFLGVPLGPDQSIQIRIDSGRAIVYGVMADNTTNDPSFELAQIVSSTPSP